MATTVTSPNPPTRVRLEVGQFNELNFASVLSSVARHPPFAHFSFGLMTERLREQLQHGANVLAIENGQLIGYAGWIRVNQAAAEYWQSGAGEIPLPDWQKGDAAIVTVTVVEHRSVLVPLMHGISHVCAGMPVYRMRSFQDGRPDMRRPPIRGRRYQFS
ncbi:MAG TPA: hypothetical protein PK129_13255 [Cellvibrionaceae bacterium]|nr:hypothetical protein [Cellvibrionaceae bacterium]